MPGFRELLRRVWFGSLGVTLSLAPASSRAQGQLGQDVVPTFQQVRLIVDADRPDYSGSIAADLEVRRSTDVLRLHSLGPVLTRISLVDASGPLDVVPEVGEHGLLTLLPSRSLTPGPARLEIDFTNEFDTQAASMYRVVTGGRSYVFTQFEAVDAREAFPCWDEPVFKFPYQLTLTVPEPHLAVSNTPIESEVIKDGMRTIVFSRTPPLPSYLLALATGPLDTVPLEGLTCPGRLITVRGASDLGRDAVTRTAVSLRALEEYFGRPHPFPKLDLIAVPEFWYGAMENPGAIVFNEGSILYDPERVGVRERSRFTGTLTHELAHLWFGDLVTMSWWDDLWLNESFATWVSAKVVHQLYPEYRRDLSMLGGRRSALRIDALPSARAIRQAVGASVNLNQLADALAYNKGETMLRMIEDWIGPDVFREGVVSYLDDFAWGNAAADDLWDALSVSSGRDLTAIMSSFLDQPGVPTVRVERLEGGRLRLSQRRFGTADASGKIPESEQLWDIPVALRYPARGGTTAVHRVLLAQRSVEVQLPISEVPEWIHPNANGTGYYLWELEAEAISALVENAEERLTPAERVGLVHDLTPLLQAGALSADQFLELTARCASDPQPEVVRAVLEAWESVRDALVPEELREEFALYVRANLAPAASRWGLLPRADDSDAVTEMRSNILLWLDRDGRDDRAMAVADSLTGLYLEDPATCPPSLATTALNLSARRADEALFDQFRERFEQSGPQERRRFLDAMGKVVRPEAVDAALRYAIDGPLRPNERTRIPGSLRDEPELQDRVYQWMKDSYDELAKTIPDDRMAYLPRYALGCSGVRIDDARGFFGNPARQRAGTQIELRKVEDQVAACQALREREGGSAAQYLGRLSRPR